MAEKLFNGRTALVTGGSGGIGRAVCLMLAGHGARVAVHYRGNAAAAAAVCAEIEEAGGEGLAVRADVALEDEVRAMVGTVRERWGPVDLLVNCAGVAETATHQKLDFAAWKRMLAVNLDGPFLTTWAVKDEMVQRRWGRIVNVASIAGVVLKGDMAHYATAKAALMAFTRHSAAALVGDGIRVNCVAPGLTDTEMAHQANPGAVERLVASTPMQRMAAPEEIAAVVKFLLGDDSSFVTGQTVVACGGRT